MGGRSLMDRDSIRVFLVLRVTEEEMRSPDYCWTHQCMRWACPSPH
ncbi:hypothetical protein ACFWFX_18705 [Streptomyces roseolus]